MRCAYSISSPGCKARATGNSNFTVFNSAPDHQPTARHTKCLENRVVGGVPCISHLGFEGFHHPPLARKLLLQFVGASLSDARMETQMTLGTLLLILLVLALVGAIPAWPYSRSWGYGPSGTVGAVLLVLLILVILGRV